MSSVTLQNMIAEVESEITVAQARITTNTNQISTLEQTNVALNQQVTDLTTILTSLQSLNI